MITPTLFKNSKFPSHLTEIPRGNSDATLIPDLNDPFYLERRPQEIIGRLQEIIVQLNQPELPDPTLAADAFFLSVAVGYHNLNVPPKITTRGRAEEMIEQFRYDPANYSKECARRIKILAKKELQGKPIDKVWKSFVRWCATCGYARGILLGMIKSGELEEKYSFSITKIPYHHKPYNNPQVSL